MTAKEKFKIGQRVRMTERAVEQYLQGTSNRRTGIVKGFPTTGFGDIPKLVYVVRDGTRTKTSYHMDFWEPDEWRASVILGGSKYGPHLPCSRL